MGEVVTSFSDQQNQAVTLAEEILQFRREKALDNAFEVSYHTEICDQGRQWYVSVVGVLGEEIRAFIRSQYAEYLKSGFLRLGAHI